MSGGSYDYAYSKLQDFASQLRRRIESRGCSSFGFNSAALRRAFVEHCEKVAAAMQAIEWNDSGDGDEKEMDLIRACLQPGEEIAAARKRAEEVLGELQAALAGERR